MALKLNESHKIAGSSSDWSQSVAYEQGSEGGNVQFTLLCQNVPVGTVIGFSGDRPGPNPPIYLPPTEVITYPSFAAGEPSEIPANYQCTITYYANFYEPPPPDAYMTLQAIFVAAG